MFSKFKQPFNIIDSKLSAFRRWFSLPTRRVFKQVIGCLLAGIIIGIVISPCLAEFSPAASFEKDFEFFNSNTMFIKSGNQQSVGVDGIIKERILENGQFTGKSGMKSITGEIESFLVFMFSGDNASEQSSEQNGESPEEIFFDHAMNLIILLCILFLGFGLPFYLLFVQRLIYPTGFSRTFVQSYFISKKNKKKILDHEIKHK